MAIRINFDVAHNPEVPTIVLAKKNGDKIGQLNAKAIEITDALNDASEITFVVHKYIDNKKCELWEQIVDFKLIHCVEWDMWFEITVELDEATETVKTVSCKSLGHAELSQVKLYDVEINTENDIARDDYKIPTVLYNASHPEASLLHRIMEKVPHYRIMHVDDTIASIQRTFTFSDTSVYDAFQEISEEIHCLFVLHSNSDENGNIQRTISVYDLESHCAECGYRGEFTSTCPNCGGSEVYEGYGNDTTIFITSDELANDIQLSSDTGAIKNCFKLEAGDDLMTATIRNCNPNGTDYIWYISDKTKSDMSKNLVDKINSYDSLNAYYQKDYISEIDSSVLTKYNSLVEKYKIYNSDLELISTPIKGYPSLMNAYYNTIDLATYLQSALMPTVVISDTNATEQASKLTRNNLSPVSVNTIADISLATADNAVLSMAKVVVDSRYKVKISTSSLERSSTYQTWTGNFTVTNYSDDTDTATSQIISVIVNDDYSSFVQQRIQKLLNKDDTEDLSISGLFKKSYNDFVVELKKYSLDCLNSFYNSCQSCIDILIEQGIGNESSWSGEDPNLYEELYVSYLNKLSAIESEIKIRQEEIDLIVGVYDTDNELKKYGLQNYIEEIKFDIQENLNFQNFLGSDLWLEFCTFRREDKYSNSNYISDGLNNAELFNKAYEFVQVAQKEIYKSAELQHSITATLKNLLVMKKFLPLTKDFQVGNWLRIMADDELYKLRLIKYVIDYDNLNDISVEFSDVVKDSSSIMSVQGIIEQATSMATSYSSVQRQAQQGEKSNSIIKTWFSDGLNATNTKIIGGADNQSQTWDSHGMLFRKYDSVTDTYDDTQLKIVNSTMAITDDNWKTVKTAVGAYYYFHPVTHKLTRAYGVNAEVMVGKLILGEQLGIYNESGSLSFDNTGFKISNGINSFRVDPNSEVLLAISNGTEDVFYIDNNGKLHISGDGSGLDVSSNSDILNMSSQITQTANAITLKVGNDEIISKINQSAEQISIEASKINLNGAVTANNYFKINIDGSMEATSGKIGGWNIGTKSLYYGADVGQAGSIHLCPSGTTTKAKIGGSDEINGWGITIGNSFGVTTSGALYASDVNLTGVITAETGGAIGGFRIGEATLTAGTAATNDYVSLAWKDRSNDIIINGSARKDWRILAGTQFGVTKDGSLFASNAKISGTINAIGGEIGGWFIDNNTITSNKDISKSVFYLASPSATSYGNWILAKDESGSVTFKVSKEGFLSATDADISGKITAKSGSIGGWQIASEASKSGDTIYYSEGAINKNVYDGSTWKGRFTISPNDMGTDRYIIYCQYDGKTQFRVKGDGTLYASNADIGGVLTAGVGSSIGDWSVDSNSIYSGSWKDSSGNPKLPDAFMSTGTSGTYTIGGKSTNDWVFGAGTSFGVTKSGALYASNVHLAGNITIDEYGVTGTYTDKNGNIKGITATWNAILTAAVRWNE